MKTIITITLQALIEAMLMKKNVNFVDVDTRIEQLHIKYNNKFNKFQHKLL